MRKADDRSRQLPGGSCYHLLMAPALRQEEAEPLVL